MPNLIRQQLTLDAALVAFTEITALSDPFTVPNDEKTVFIIKNSSDAALALTITPRNATAYTPFGKQTIAPITLSIPSGGTNHYCFRVPPKPFTNGDGLISIAKTGHSSKGQIAALRVSDQHLYAGGVTAAGGDASLGVKITNSQTLFAGVSVNGTAVCRKGHNSIWLAKNGGVGAVAVAIQTQDTTSAKNFGPQYGIMKNESPSFPGADFIVHQLSIPNGGLWYACVRPGGAFEGKTGTDYGAVGIQTTGACTIARLDLGEL